MTLHETVRSRNKQNKEKKNRRITHKDTHTHTHTNKISPSLQHVVTTTSSTNEENVQVKIQRQFTSVCPSFRGKKKKKKKIQACLFTSVYPETRCGGESLCEPLAQPGGGHPLWLSVQLVYEPAQLVESLVWIHVHDCRVKVVAKIVLHLTGLLDHLFQLLWLCTHTIRPGQFKTVRQCGTWILSV